MNRLKLMALQVAGFPLPRYGIQSGIGRIVAYKKDVTFGTPAAGGAATGQKLRRVQFGLSVQKDTFVSNEKASHQQDADFRHGFKKVAGTISGELSPATYADWHDSLMRRARTTVAAIAAVSLTIAVSGLEYTITRAAGSYLTDGIKKGMVVRITAGAVNANNLNKNIVVRLVTATIITGKPLNQNLTLTAEGPIAGCTMTIPGKYSYMPNTGQLDESYTIEDYHGAIAVPKSELYYGCKMNSMKATIPSSGIATVDWDVLGYAMNRANAAYFSSPTAETSTGLLASNIGQMFAGDTQYATVTNADFTAQGNLSSGPVVGADLTPAIFFDKFQAMGNISAYFDDATLRDAFLDETTVGIVIVIAADATANCDFISYMFPKCKLNGAGKDDPNTGIQQSIPFKALYNAAGGVGIATEQTTMAYQDSAA